MRASRKHIEWNWCHKLFGVFFSCFIKGDLSPSWWVYEAFIWKMTPFVTAMCTYKAIVLSCSNLTQCRCSCISGCLSCSEYRRLGMSLTRRCLNKCDAATISSDVSLHLFLHQIGVLVKIHIFSTHGILHSFVVWLV